MSKSIDGIMPPAKTKMEGFERWMNHQTVVWQKMPYAKKTRIYVKESHG